MRVAEKSHRSAARLQPAEAVAVLAEIKRQAEQRLLDACQEFQDIAHEMEWRLRQWDGLRRQRDELAQTLRERMGAHLRFNAQSKKRVAKAPSDRGWRRLGRALQLRLERLEAEISENTAAIMTRNEEGRYLEEEIIHLQQRVERIALGLKGHRRTARVVRTVGETAEALARLSVELSIEPDVADIDVLLSALGEVDARLREG